VSLPIANLALLSFRLSIAFKMSLPVSLAAPPPKRPFMLEDPDPSRAEPITRGSPFDGPRLVSNVYAFDPDSEHPQILYDPLLTDAACSQLFDTLTQK
jgi:hypothetical protein